MATVTYNSYALPNVYGKPTFRLDEKSLTFTCDFLITADSEAALLALCDTTEEKLTEINKNLSVTYAGSTEWSLEHAASTGFLARPSLTKLAVPQTAGVSRAYRFSVNMQLPFDQSPYGYRRAGSFSFSYGRNRQRIANFSLEYTAGGGNTAYENYDAGGRTWAESILLGFGGTYELVSENFDEEQEEKILTASLTYKEIIAKQDSAGLDNTGIVDPTCNYSVSYDQDVGVSETGGYSAIPLVTVYLTYSTQISKDIVTSENNLEAVYHATVKPWLISHAYGLLGLGNYSQAGQSYIVQSERKTINPYDYRISGNLVFIAPRGMDQILELSEMVSESEDKGISHEKLWDGLSHTYNLWTIGATRTLRRSITITKLGSQPAGPAPLTAWDGGQLVHLNTQKSKSVQRHGVGTAGAGLNSVLLFSMSFDDTYLFVKPARVATIGPGGLG